MRAPTILPALALTFAACSGAHSPGGAYAPRSVTAEAPATERPGLGTSFGERVDAPISFEPFTRASSSPYAVLALHYNDAEGVRAHADYMNDSLRPVDVRTEDGAISLSLVDESGRLLPGYNAGDKTLVVGEDGERYRILVRNTTDARFEVVASVDGLDVMDGRPASPERRGYIVEPNDEIVIQGFRTSDQSVAAFRFGSVADSYAAQTSGDRNVGVVGLAVFPEKGAVWSRGELRRRDTANPFPSERRYSVPPRGED